MTDAMDYLKSKVPALEQLLAAHQSQVLEQSRKLEQALAVLRTREEELQTSNVKLEEFAYVASHDLKAPLRAIRNLAEWITEDAGTLLPQKSLGHLETIQQRVRGMEKLVGNLLEYSRAGRVKGEIEEVETSGLVDEIVAFLQLPPGFTVVVSSEMPTLTTDPVPLEQVFRNLIANAVDHHDRSTGRIEVRANDLGERVEFVVSDDGPGIAAEYHDRIFEMFQTFGRRDGVAGTGMGLAIVKELVASQGGSIRMESKEQRGTIFRFTWPRKADEEPIDD